MSLTYTGGELGYTEYPSDYATNLTAEQIIEQNPDVFTSRTASDYTNSEEGGMQENYAGTEFITNHPDYSNWSSNVNNPLTGSSYQQWELKTNPNEWADEYPDNRPTEQTFYVAYNNRTDEYTGGYGLTKDEAKEGAPEGGDPIRVIEITVGTGSGIGEALNAARDPRGNPITGFRNVLSGLQEERDRHKQNQRDNEAAAGQRQAAMDQWNYENVYEPATAYANSLTSEAATWRENQANNWNENLETYAQSVADEENERNTLLNDYGSSLTEWSRGVKDWASSSQTGVYTSNRSYIYNNLGSNLTNIVNNLNTRAEELGLQPLMNEDQLNNIIDSTKNIYGAYYAEQRIGQQWNGETDGGAYDLIGQFDSDYYLNTQNSNLIDYWNNAVVDEGNILSADNDLDVTAAYGSLANMAWYDYTYTGKNQGLRGSQAGYAREAEEYDESYSSMTDAEKQRVRDQLFGLTGANNTIEWAENILDPSSDQTQSLLEGRISSAFSEADIEQQDKFRALATDVLEKAVNELNKQQARERELDVYRGLPGFNEIYGSSQSLADNMLGDMRGYLNLGGMQSRGLEENLREGIENITGIGRGANAEYNWQKWMDETLKPYYEGLEEIEGERVDEDGNKITYSLTNEEGREFITKFLSDYITPRFNMSKSMSEFVSYLDTLDEDEQNIFQTQTAMNQLKQTAELKAREYFEQLSGTEAGFDTAFYMDPLSQLDELTEDELNRDYTDVETTRRNYEEQKTAVQRDWAAAKSNADSKSGIPEGANEYSWSQWAYYYGVDINNADQFAKLHYQIAGQRAGFDPAKDVFDVRTIDAYISDVIVDAIADERVDIGDAAFMQFVTPDEFATALLEGIDPLENQEEWEKVLESFGIENLDASLEEVKEYIKEAFETGAAQDIREGIKYLNERRKTASQENLGVDYIQRDPLEILGERGDIEVGSEAWKDLMISYNLDENLSYDQASLALRDIERVDEETTNPLFEYFKSNGYAGSQDDFLNEFFPDASSDEIADLNFVGRALQGGFGMSDIDMSDPFAAMSQFNSFLGDSGDDLYGRDDDDDNERTNNYFDVFPDERDYASSTGRGIIDTWTGGLFG